MYSLYKLILYLYFNKLEVSMWWITNFTTKWKETTVNKLHESDIIQLRAGVQDCGLFFTETQLLITDLNVIILEEVNFEVFHYFHDKDSLQFTT